MSRVLDTRSRAEEITRAISHLLATDGAGAVTMRAVADIVGISVGTLAGHLTNKERMVRVCAHKFGRRRVEELKWRLRERGFHAFLPLEGVELQDERAWIAWRELARATRLPTAAFVDVDRTERVLLSTVPELAGVDRLVVEALHATIRGLCEARCAAGEFAMSAEWAGERLGAAVAVASSGVVHPDLH